MDTRHEIEKKRAKPIWVDWLIVLLVLAVCVFGGYYLYRRYRAVAPTVKIQYTVCVLGVDSRLADANGGWEGLIPMGASVTSANGTAILGEILDVSVRPHSVASILKDDVVFVEHPSKCDLFVTVQGEGVVKEGDGIRIHDIRIAAGDTGDYRLGDYCAVGATVVSVIKEGET